jgi:hypothetical protein
MSIPTSFRSLDPSEIIRTVQQLQRRISERFPGSGLASVCLDLAHLAQATQARARAIAAPRLGLRLIVLVVIAGGIAALIAAGRVTRVRMGDADVIALFQGIEAAINIIVLAGAALFFLFTLESRIKRQRVLRDLHELRSLAHVVDMHQLTKDPGVILGVDRPTESSPQRITDRFLLTRYLDYCSEMLALIGKLAALYGQYMPDSVIIDAVNDIETLTAGLGRNIWQKIAIIEAYDGTQAASIAPRE